MKKQTSNKTKKKVKTKTINKLSCFQEKGIWAVKNLLPMLFFPIASFYLMELYLHNPFTGIKMPIQFMNFFFFELVMAIFLLLFGKLKAALILQSVLAMVIGLANYYVIQFRSAPIMPWDIFSIKTAASVADNFKYTLEPDTILVIIGFLIIIFLESRLTFSIHKKHWRLRLAGLLVSFGLLWGFTHMLHQDSTIARFRMYDKLFTPTVVTKRNGTAVAFLMELKYVSVKKPAGYSTTTAKELLASYDSYEEVTDTPNIIVIMNEAFSDLSVLGDFETNEDYMPFVHSLMEGADNTVSGYLNVSVLGGNTANTEFEFLTGNSMAFLPQGSIPFQQYVKSEMPSIASHLKELGYQTIGMHPYYSTGWNRNTVYPMLGFDSSYFINDWKNPKLIRKYVSDESSYDKIIDLYEQKEAGTPLFLFNVTMQNHSSYSEEYDNFTPDITVADTNSKILPNYLSLIKISDQALENLISYFENQSEKTIVVFFGDHQPTNSVVSPIWKMHGKTSDTLTEEDEALRYKVPYFIWANYDIPEASDVETSTNFLGGSVLKIAGLPCDSYTAYLNELRNAFPVITSIRAENAAGHSDLIKNQEKNLNTYGTLQYYNLFGRN